METKKIARELVTSSSSARTNTFLLLVLIAIITLSLFIFSPSVRATVEIPKMTESQANQIIEYMTNDTSWTNYRINSNDYVSTSELINNLILQNSQELADIFNLCISNYSGDVQLNWNNINLIIAKGNNSNNSHCFTYSFIISNYDINEENNLDFIRFQQAPAFTRFFNTQVFENRKCYYFQIRFEWQNNVGDFFVEKELQELTLNNSIRLYPRQNPNITDNKVSFISLLNLGSINNPIFHTQVESGYYLNIKNLGLQNQNSYIEDNSSGDNGYYFINEGVLTINYSKWLSQNLKQNFFIGKNLNMINNYYYYNESGDKINANNLILMQNIEYPASGEKTGKIYFPKTTWVRYQDYYPYNIYQKLIVQYESGEEILEEKTIVEDLLVINWSDSSISGDIKTPITGTITNPSGDVIGNYSGENDNNNLINWITEEPNYDVEITQEEIQNATGIETVEDPYASFWYEFSTGLGNALTDTSGTIRINWLGYIYEIKSSDFAFNYPQDIRWLLQTISTVVLVWVMLKWTKGITNEIQSGGIIHSDQYGEDMYITFM